MASPARFELAASGLGIQRSILLSYGESSIGLYKSAFAETIIGEKGITNY